MCGTWVRSRPGEIRSLKATFRCNRIGKIKNAATVSYCAEATDECELEVKGIPAVLLECVDDPDPIELGNSVTYTIAVTNQGTAVGTNIVIECTLPNEQEYVSSVGQPMPQRRARRLPSRHWRRWRRRRAPFTK